VHIRHVCYSTNLEFDLRISPSSATIASYRAIVRSGAIGISLAIASSAVMAVAHRIERKIDLLSAIEQKNPVGEKRQPYWAIPE
jgi:hypothetical protein